MCECVCVCVCACVCPCVFVCRNKFPAYLYVIGGFIFATAYNEGGFCLPLYKGYIEKFSCLTLIMRHEHFFRVGLWFKKPKIHSGLNSHQPDRQTTKKLLSII